uniref:Uncharacterized protein n=1 Tax=Kalanchoe fedtschenkoi TaxID=63787 RepID=A0A7N1A1A8_KALFE
MGDSHRSGFPERDIEQAIASLKKGTQLLKYGRRGKPKFCPFRLSNDETMLMWFSGKEEKFLNLSQVSRIIPGQRTAIFQRYPRPEKEYQSFSLLYNGRSLDLICKDKDEADVWFIALKALISRPNYRKSGSGVEYTRGSISSESAHSAPRRSSPTVAFELGETRLQIPFEAPQGGLGKAFSDIVTHTALIKKNDEQGESVSHALSSLSAGCVDNSNCRGSTSEFRISLSSAVSSSSQGSLQDDFDALGAVFMWGESIGSGLLGGGSDRVEKSNTKADALLPKPLESTVALKVQNIACGRRHAMLITKQGEIHSWGEEMGGRLGHGVEADVSHPKFIDALSDMCIDVIACGEYHSCAVSHSGDLYTWGDGAHNIGLLGHGSEVSHWIPKKVGGLMDSISVVYISCGSWHTAIVTSSGQLFTFGDGTFGALGHGDRSSTNIPREVETLSGLRTLRVACGVWHSAAVVEIVTASSGAENSCSVSNKLFTWGDGDKDQLGHGDRETKLTPVMVYGLDDESIQQVACGYQLTLALTTTGHVYTMGSSVYGQLGNPEAKGKAPTRVRGNIENSSVEEIACGFYHVVVLTSEAQVYTWGKGADGQLGHGDTNDRNEPTLVTFLKDKQVKSIACGPNYSAAICPHQWASSVDHSICAGCHNQFGLRRKRHNCYNCGLAFCKACSSKKSLKASMALDQNRPYRVCDDCFSKLKKAMETGPVTRIPKVRSVNFNQKSGELIEGYKTQQKLSRLLSIGSFNQLENQLAKPINDNHIFPRLSQDFQWTGSRVSDASFSRLSSAPLPSRSAPLPGRPVHRAVSPVSSRNPSPPSSSLPFPTGLAFDTTSEGSNTHLHQEIVHLKEQVKDLTCKSQHLEEVLERTVKQLEEASASAAKESKKYKAAMEVIESLTAKLNDVAEKNQEKQIVNQIPDSKDEHTDNPPNAPLVETHASSLIDAHSINLHKSFLSVPKSTSEDTDTVFSSASKPVSEKVTTRLPNGSKTDAEKGKASLPNGKKRTETANTSSSSRSKAEGDKTERVIQDEPGVYVTLTPAAGGGNELKRVRFSRKRFTEEQAEKWWAENGAKLCEKYNIHVT